MKVLPAFFLLLLPLSCSFRYQDIQGQGSTQPDMIFTDVTLRRYTDTRLDLQVYAKDLEMYDEEKIWAGKHIVFVQYDEKTQKESMKGETGILYIDEKSEEYALGGTVFFHLIEDDFSVTGPALIWKKKENLLAAPAEEKVRISQGDTIQIEGTSFAANTAAKAFVFTQGSTGTILIKEKEESEKKSKTEES